MKWRYGLILPGLLLLLVSHSAFGQTSQPAEPPAKPKADIIFIHGNVYTGVGGAAQFGQSGRVEAIAVRADRILATGTNDEVLKLKGPQTQVIDMGGHFVMPGFNDAHVHLAEGGFERLNVNMIGVKS